MKHPIRFLSFVLVTLLFVARVSAENELFPFVISFDAPDNVTNISSKLDAPAGKHGFIRIKDSHFVNDKGRVQFWGTNTCFGANFLDHAAADRMADRFARFGINCVRLHHMDSRDIWGKNIERTKMEFDKDQIDKLDYYIAALKKRGVYVNINLHVSRTLDDRDGFPKDENRPSHDKGIDNYYRPFIEANKKYAKDLLEHVNPYTGTAYKDEPCVAMIEINNENSIIQMWGGWGGLDVIQDPFNAELRNEWNNWLKAKYKNDAGLRKAWNCRSVPLGKNLLKHDPDGRFPAGFTANGKGWNWETDEKADAPVTNTDGVLRLDVRKKGKVDWHPQLLATGFAVKKDQLYTLTVKAKASCATPVNIGVRMNHEPWEGLGFDAQAKLTPAWQTFQFVFEPSVDDDNARISFGGLKEGTVYDLESVSLKPGGEVGLPKESSLGSEILKNAEFDRHYVPKYDGWNWELGEKTEAPISNDGHALKLDVRKKGEFDWHPQLSGGPIPVVKGREYTLSLTARANKAASFSIGLRMNHEPWQSLGFDAREDLSTEWKTFSYTVVPDADDGNARITLSGLREGTVYEVDSISLKPGVPGGDKETSLAGGNIPVVWKKEVGRFTKEAVDDFCDFLLDIEAKYWNEMYRYLKDDIKVKQPVSGTQLEYGSTHAQAAMDYCDIHSYWNHPSFPGRPWDGNNWYLRNRALVNYLDRQILPNLATKRVWGKPFTVSEYNHPYPNQYAGEGLPLLAAFGAFQGWDGIFPFAYAHSINTEPKRAASFFDTCGNTVQMAHMIACHGFFCDDYNVDADKDMVVAPLTVDAEREIFKRVRGPYSFGFSGLGLDARIALTRPTAVDTSGKVLKMPALPEIPKDQKEFAAEKSPIRYEHYDLTKAGQGFASLSGKAAALFTGFVEEGKDYPFANGTVRFGKTNLGWATVSFARGADKDRCLLVATGQMMNTDMKLEPLDEDKITVGTRWGKDPVCCEGVPATVNFVVSLKSMKCWALDESGNRKQEIAVKKTTGGFSLDLKPEYKTIWYEIETAR